MNVFAVSFSDAMLDWRFSLVVYLSFGLAGGLGVALLINFFADKSSGGEKKKHRKEPAESTKAADAAD